MSLILFCFLFISRQRHKLWRWLLVRIRYLELVKPSTHIIARSSAATSTDPSPELPLMDQNNMNIYSQLFNLMHPLQQLSTFEQQTPPPNLRPSPQITIQQATIYWKKVRRRRRKEKSCHLNFFCPFTKSTKILFSFVGVTTIQRTI